MAVDVESPSSPWNLSYPITLKFVDLTYRRNLQKNRRRGGFNIGAGSSSGDAAAEYEQVILDGITGTAFPGEILAVLGPSGSGKSTFLNAVSGRLQGRGLTGTVLANGTGMTRSVLKRVGFVAQDDVLYPHLTVRETLVFCALLRLPDSLSAAEKAGVAESVMSELGLRKCGNTVVGNGVMGGVSGGERKRISIGHEMLMNPSLVVLDELTSCLDATAAHRLVGTLAGLARERGKTVVMSVHQPSSRVYQMFDSVMLLSEGECVYFGKGGEAMGYFDGVGFRPSFPVNPADFLLDLANGVCQIPGGDKPDVRRSLVSSYTALLAPKIRAAAGAADANEAAAGDSRVHRDRRRRSGFLELFRWWSQFTILLRRSIKERRHESFNCLRVSQVVAAAVLASAMWWRSDYRDVRDRLGLLYFLTIFWGVLPSFNAVFAFPLDRAVLAKERASGMYSLSAYFMARVAGDLPMELALPAAFTSVSYWMTGLRPDPAAFLLTLAVLLVYVMVCQGLGLMLGAAIMDARRASTVATVAMLAFVLTGGYYVHRVPGWLAWAKYASVTFYGYRLLIWAQYGGGERLWAVLGCSGGNHHAAADCKLVEEDVAGQIGAAECVWFMVVMLIGYRLMAYLALRPVRI